MRLMKRISRTVVTILLLATLSLSAAGAEAVRARILVGAREAAVSPAPVYDGGRVLAPLGILKSLGASYVESPDGRLVTVITAGGQSGEITAVDVDNTTMLPMDKVLALVGGESNWDAEKRVLTLTACLRSVEFVDDILKINCSFPVSYSVGMWSDKLWVDIDAAKVESEAREVYIDTGTVARARLGQDGSRSRVTLDLKKSVGYKIESEPVAAQVLLKVAEGIPKPAPVKSPAKADAARPFTVDCVRVEPVGDSEFSVVISTSGKGSAAVSYGVRPPEIVLDLRAGKLADSLTAAEGSHPLLKKIGLVTAGNGSRIEIGLSRIMVYDMHIWEDSIRVNVRVPDGAGGDLAGKFIVIDPGHGGSQKGARSGNVYEKAINMRIASEIAAALEAEGARAMLSRTDDYTMGLAARSEVAIDNKADLFVSIHCNSNGTLNSATGIETYYHMQESSPKALAHSVQASVCLATGMCDRRARSDGNLYSSGLAVLRRLSGTGIPGVLLECGYLNSSSDRAKLVDSAYRKKLAAGVVAGLKAYVEGTPIE